MKNIFYKLTMICVVAALFSSCERELAIDFTGDDAAPGLRIKVQDASGNPVSGATVDLFNSLDGYITEQGAIGSASTDGSGEVAFDQSVLTERGVYYFSVSSGALRNWSSTVATDYLLLNSGETFVTTSLAEVSQAFINLTTGAWTNVTYGTPGMLPCDSDDVFTFLKDGTVTRAHGANACSPESTFQQPISATGAVWSKWTVETDGAGDHTLNIRDLDPAWDSGNCNHTNAASVSASDCSSPGLTFGTNMITIDYGGAYIATLTAL